MAGALVSIIVPAYNAAEFLGEALESALAQDWEPLEVVVVDDGSTDATADVARSFPEVKYFHQENAGAAAARNRAVEESSGEFVAIFDADDTMPPIRVPLQAGRLLEDPGLGCVFGRQEWMNPPPWLARDAVYGDLDGIPLGSAMFRRGVLDELGGYDTTFTHSEDMDLVIRMRERGIRFEILPQIVYHRRYREGSLTGGRGGQAPPLLRSMRARLERERGGSA